MVDLRCNAIQETREGCLGVNFFTLFDLMLELSTEADYVSSIALLFNLTYHISSTN
jgi:hypothetical protein